MTIRGLEATSLATVKAGDYVKWKASKGEGRGQVVSVHTSSHVPAVPVRLQGSDTRPAARVRVYAKVEGGWVPTETYVALHADHLNPADELVAPPAPATEGLTPGSFDDIRQRVRLAIAAWLAAQPGSSGESWAYVCDIGPGWAVFESGSALWMIGYADDGATVTLDPSGPTEVYELTSYMPVSSGTEADGTVRDTIEGRLLAAGSSSSDGGRVFRVRIIRFGESSNGRLYTADVMRAAVPLYEGAKAFDHHRTDAEMKTSTVTGIVGSYHNVEATAEGIDADLRLLPGAAYVGELLDRSLENQAAGLPPLVGISHDVLARYDTRVEGGRRIDEARQIVAVASADVVAHPAAGGQATRMVAAADPTYPPTHPGEPVNLKQLLALLRQADATKRVELLRENAATITAAGLTDDDVVRLAEAAPTPPAPPAPSAPATPEVAYARGSIMGGQLVTSAVTAAGLDTRLVEAVKVALPEHFTESQLVAHVAQVRSVAEGFELAGLKPTVPSATVTKDDQDKRIGALDKLVAGERGGYRSMKEAFMHFTGARPDALDTADFNRRVLRESAVVSGETRMFDSSERLSESLTSSSWGYALGDSITRRMVALYDQPDLSFWRQIVSSMPPINDFRTQRVQRIGGYGVLPTVLEGGTYQSLTSPGNDTEITWAVSKKGGIEDLTLEDIANDDVRAIQQIPVRLAGAAAQTVFRFVFDFFVNNAAVNDGVTLFHASHANTAASALSSSALSAVRLKMRQQAAYGDTSNVLMTPPRFLLVPSTLEELAFQLCTSAVAIPSGSNASNIPNLHTGLTHLVLDYWTSQTQWYLVADPNRMPTIEVGFYQGRDQPELFVQSDAQAGSVWSADKISYKIRHIYGGNVLDYRAFQRGNS